jgi:hypothetical protein
MPAPAPAGEDDPPSSGALAGVGVQGASPRLGGDEETPS